MQAVKKLMQVSQSVWIVPPDWKAVEPTIGFVITDEGVAVIDTGNSPAHARRALDALRNVTDQPIKYVINTHRHWDHTFGNQLFRAPIVAHALCRKKMMTNLRDDWAPDRVMGWVTGWVLPRVKTLSAEQFQGLRLVLPQMTFCGILHLHLGRQSLHLQYAGGGHTRDSIVVHVPREGVLFLSDCLYPNPEGKILKLATLFPRLSKLPAETYIPGHEMPYDREGFARRADYYHELIQNVTRLHRQRAAPEKILEYPLAARFRKLSGSMEKSHRELVARLVDELRGLSR